LDNGLIELSDRSNIKKCSVFTVCVVLCLKIIPKFILFFYASSA